MASSIDSINIPDLKLLGYSEVQEENFIRKFTADVKKLGEHSLSFSIIDFFKLVQNVVWTRQQSEGIKEENSLLVLLDDPPEDIDTEAVTFVLKSRYPGQFNRGKAGQNTIKEVRPHLRSVIQHPDHPGEKLAQTGVYYDNWITVNLYARNNITALKRVLWLESVITDFIWYFKVFGIGQVIYEGTSQLSKVKIGDLELFKYPMSYFVRTENITSYGIQELKDVNFTTDILN